MNFFSAFVDSDEFFKAEEFHPERMVDGKFDHLPVRTIQVID